MPDQRGMIDLRRIAHAAVPDSMGDDFFNLRRGIPQFFQACRNGLVDDLEVAASGQFLELDQGEVRLDPGGIAIHHQPDGASRGNHG